MDDSVRRSVHQGDLISLHVDSIGYFGTPSQKEPIPERSDVTSHLRAITTGNDDVPFPQDFNSRCTFVITGEKGSSRPLTAITYGSFIRLKHKSTNCTLIASHQEDDFDEENCYNSVYLRSYLSPMEEMASTWQVLTRYRLRNEGDAVESDDFIVLRNSLFKNKYLTSIAPPATTISMSPSKLNHLVGLRRDESFFKLGWKIRVMLPFNNAKNMAKNKAHEEGDDGPGKVLLSRAIDIEGGMFVRMTHLESNGHFIARYDDSHVLTASMAPLGQFCQQTLDDPSHNVGIFVRGHSVENDPNSALSIWQILPAQLHKLGRFFNGDSIRFRHVLTGQYLCIRQVNEEKDSVSIRTRSVMKAVGNNPNKPQPTLRRTRSNADMSKYGGDDLLNTDYTVATTPEPDYSTLFHILTSDSITDTKEDFAVAGSSAITNQSDVFFLHEDTHFILEEKKRKTSSSNNQKKNDGSSKDKAKWEDYNDDIHIRPSRFNDSNVAVLREVYNLEPVPDVEVADVLYISKFLPIIKSAIVTLQHTKKMSVLYLPLFRHLNVATHTLISWVMNQNDSDNSLLLHPALTFDPSQHIEDKDIDDHIQEEEELNALERSFDQNYDVDNIRFEYQSVSEHSDRHDEDIFDDDESFNNKSVYSSFCDSTKYSISSLGPWIGRGMSPFKKSAIVNPIHSSRNPTFADFNPKRQNIVSDSRILDLLVLFTTLVFRLLKDQVLYLEKRENQALQSKHTADELKAMYHVPSLLTGTCILVHDLVHSVVYENRRNSVRILSVKGTLLDMMDQEILGWNPPIGTLLIALQSMKRGTVQRGSNFDPTMVLDDQNIHNLIRKTYELYMTNNESAVNLIKLLTTLCSPGKIPNPIFQSLILKAIFATQTEEDFEHDPPDSTEIVNNLSHSLLFSTRKVNGAAWQVKFKTPYKMITRHTDEETMKRSIVEELRALIALINPVARDGRLNITEVREFLTTLGLGGHSLYEESNFLECSDFHLVMEWFWRKRSHYFPSSRTSLNEITYEKVKAMIDVEVVLARCAGIKVSRNCDRSLSEFDDELVSESETSDSEEETDDDAQSAIVAARNRANSLSNILKREATVERNMSTDSGDPGFAAPKSGAGGVFRRLFQRKQQQYQEQELQQQLQQQQQQPQGQLVLQPVSDISDTEVATSDNDSSAGQAKQSTPKRGFFSRLKKTQEAQPEPARQLSRRDILRKESKDKALSLSPYEEFCEFREYVLLKIPDFDVGSYHDLHDNEYDHGTKKIQDSKNNYGGIVKKGLSMFLLYSTEQTMNAMKKKIKNNKGRSLAWNGLFQVLGHSSFERDWFRQSMIMMAELCRGENLQAQTLVNQLFPAAMVLDMLSFGGENSDKLAVVTLLQNLYVVHDLVFPVAATSGVKRRGGKRGNGNGSGIICSLNEGDSSILFNDAGKVFNNLTRSAPSINDGQPSSKVLRKMLWRNLSNEVDEIDLNSRDNEVLAYHTCLLTLLRELICKGFFVESGEFEAEYKRMKEVSRSSNVKVVDKNEKKSFFSFFSDISAKSLSFDEKDIEKILVRKITEMVDNNRDDIDSVQSGLLKTLDNWKAVNKISEDEHANIRQKLIKNSNPVSVGSEHINIVKDYFTENFSNSIKILLVEEVISILDLIYDSHQLSSVKEILKLLNNSDHFFIPDVLHGDALVSDHPIKFTGVQSTIKRLFISSREHEAMYTNAMLALTLFNSDKVKCCAYDLLYKNVSKKMNANEIISNLQILVCPKKSATLRLFQQFQYVARKYAHQMIAETDSSQFEYKKFISFAMNATKSLCYHVFHEKSTVSLLNITRPGSIDFMSGKLDYIPLISNGLVSDDDGDGIEMLSNKGASYNISMSTNNANASLLAVTAKFIRFFNTQVEDHASDVSRDLLTVYMKDINNLANSRSGTCGHWMSLSSDQQFFIDAMLDMCATICVQRPALVIELLVNISKVATSFVWYSPGASRVTELLCEYCDVSGMIDESDFMLRMEELFLETVRDQKPNADVIRLIHAVLASNRDNNFMKHCHSFVDKHLLSNGSMRQYILLDMPDPTPKDIEFHFQILRMFATFANISSKSILLKMKACLTVDFCQQLLSSCCPLQIKMCVITFCVRIYNSKEIPMLSYIAVDLNNILESIELGDTSSSAGTTSANAGSGQSASTDFSPRRLDPIRNPLLQYLEAVANVIVDTAVTDFLVDRNDISIIKSSIDNVHRDKSFLAALKTKKVVVLSYIEKKIIDTFEKEGIDSKKLTQFFEVLLPFYNIVKSTNMSSFRDLLFAKSEVFESVYSMFITAFLMMCGLTKSKDAVTFTKETMEQTDTKLNPNLVVKSHIEAMILTISLRRIEYENSVCREHFLLLDGIDLYNHQVARLLYEDSTHALSHNKKYDIASFALSLDYSHELSSAFIQQTTFFQVLQKHLHTATHFLENGGKDLIQGTLVNETSTLKRTPDFDKWTMCGGLYFHSLGTYMQNFSKPTSVNFFLLHALCELLENKIDKIRTSNETTKRKIKLMGKEVARLQKFQDTFENLGICDLVLAVVGRSLDDSLDDPFVFEFVPLALKVGFSMLASGNDSVQHALIGSYKSDHSTGMVGSHKKHFMEALRRILRGVILKIDNFVKLTSSGGKRTSKDFTFPINMFKLLIKIFDFCGSLCSGHNDQSRNFLRDQDHVGEPVDIVFDIAKAVNSLLGMLVSQMRYITFDHFYELLAPPVWDYYPDIKRRFIKWHDPRVNFDFVCQIFATLSSGFNALTEISQGPCFKNQPSALVATPYCQDLLEYVGAMQLRAKKNKAGATSFFDSKSIVWDGRHPLSFNKTYKHELKKIGRFRDDPDYELIIRQINSLSENSKETKRFNARMKLLTSMAQQVEQNCLRFLLALLEATSPLVSETLMGQLNDGILLQNMENQYKLSFESKGKLKKFRSDVTVSYLTLISIMASAMRDDPTAMLDDFLLQWKQDNAAQGYNTEKLVASIEVTSMDGTVQRVYFAIPAFVTRYWVYPEVQKAKDKFLWAVSRESPEDKLSDFYDRSDGLIQVMRRQEALRHVLTPLVHGIFGGVNFLVEKIVILQYFKMQPIFLMLSCCFNLANMYWQYREQYPWIVAEEYGFFKEILEFDQRDQYVFYLYCVHFSLAVALFIRAFLNSPAADNYKVINIFGRKNIFDIVINGLIKLTLTMMDSWWPICLMAFSAAGILINPYFFAPILLDLINQIRLMSFLLEAITRNLGRIAYTLLLAIIFLYLFAVITIVSFEDQYALAGKSACKDLISCFKLQIDYGLVNPPEWVGDGYIDPWISADAESTSYGHIASIIAGSVFNFSYIILINLVLQAIISGLIIDTFSEMRAESEEIEVDIREKCFICSIDRDEFEQLDIPFVEHTKTEHNMWQYIWFMIYLESKDPLSYTGPEQYLSENLTDKNGFVRLGPIRKSLSIKLKAGKAKEKISLKTVMDSIRETNIIQSAIRAKVDKTDKLAKDTNKAITSQKAKILEIEKLLTSSSETAMATGDHVADFKDDVNKKLVVILNTLGKKAHPSDHAHHHAAGTEHATTRPSDVSRNSQSSMSERPNPFEDNDDDSSMDDNASVVSGVGDL